MINLQSILFNHNDIKNNFNTAINKIRRSCKVRTNHNIYEQQIIANLTWLQHKVICPE